MVQTKTKKVYDFNMPRVKNELVKVIKKQKNESTVADLISASGLPKFQVEETIKVVMNEYRGHLKVSESGELLYYFPQGMRNQVKGFIPGLKRFFSEFAKVMVKILAFLFKIWIVVMLVGYFILFLLILVAAVLATLAISFGGKGRSRSSSRGGIFYLVIKLFELFARIWFYGQILKGPGEKKRGRPLHKAVFAFIFGEPDPNREWETAEKKHVISFIQSHKGVITLEELMIISGKDTEQANELINRYLLEFEGEPQVTDDGSIFYFFPELLRTSRSLTERTIVPLQNPAKKQLIPFSYNEKKKNGWIGFFNGFNLAFGSYFLYYALTEPYLVMEFIRQMPVVDFAIVYRFLNSFLKDITANPAGIILIGLGIIPLAFSFLFYLIPLMRNIQRKKLNEGIKQENFRKRIYASMHSNPMSVNPGAIQPAGESETPKNSDKFKDKVIKQFVGGKYGDVEATTSGAGGYIYVLKEYQRQISDVNTFRDNVDLNKYAVGETIFDSGE
ncbi:MAG: hypothetical protein JXB88_24140 [Spirochaetales bacterium]|nr:hypothetical protein [Spirochaetales bacterium]